MGHPGSTANSRDLGGSLPSEYTTGGHIVLLEGTQLTGQQVKHYLWPGWEPRSSEAASTLRTFDRYAIIAQPHGRNRSRPAAAVRPRPWAVLGDVSCAAA